jgi:hypothetical protein
MNKTILDFLFMQAGSLRVLTDKQAKFLRDEMILYKESTHVLLDPLLSQ